MRYVILLLGLVALLALVAGLVMWAQSSPATPQHGPGTSSSSVQEAIAIGGQDYTGTNGGLRPSKFSMFGRTHYFQIPPNPKGLFVMLPGCVRWGPGFWTYHPSAPECTGFPENVSHTKQVLARGYAMLVYSQADGLCISRKRGDMEQICPLIHKFQQTYNLQGKPLFLAGASSGGSAAIRLPEQALKAGPNLRIHGIICEVATNQSPMNGTKLSAPDFPPVVYVCMERDKESIREATEHVKALRANNVPADMVVSPIRQITPSYFSDRMSTITPEYSQKIVAALKDHGILGKDGWLVANPAEFNKRGSRAYGWMAFLAKHLPKSREFALGSVGKSPIMQAMAVAYAAHDTIADYTTAALVFFEANGNASLSDLKSRYKIDVPASLK